jgi:hypothetical protein
MIPQTLPDATTLKRIAGLPPGWHLITDIAWEVAGDDPDARRAVVRLLESLYAGGRIERQFVYSRGRPQATYLIDSNLAAELEQ